MAIVERYHKPLRRAHDIIKDEASCTNKSLILQMAIKAINDTAGPNGIVPTLLVFGAFPRIIAGDAPTVDIMTRAKTIKKAMTEVTKIRAKRQIQDAINTRNGPSVDISAIPLGSNVLVWRPHKNKWEGPYKLVAVQNESATVQLPLGPSVFRSTCIKTHSENNPSDGSPIQLDEDNNLEQQHENHVRNDDQFKSTRPQGIRRLPDFYGENVYLSDKKAQLFIFYQTCYG